MAHDPTDLTASPTDPPTGWRHASENHWRRTDGATCFGGPMSVAYDTNVVPVSGPTPRAAMLAYNEAHPLPDRSAP